MADLSSYVGEATVLTNFYGQIGNAVARNQQIQEKRAEEARKRQAAAQKELSSQISKINPAGLRTADVADYNRLYQEMKDAAISAYNSSNPQERMAAEAQVKERANQLSVFIDQSKQLGKTEQDLGTWLGNDPYTAGEDNIKRYSDYVGTPLMKLPTDVYNRTNWIRPPDFGKIDKDLNTLASELLKQADSSTLTESGVLGGKPGDWYWDTKEVPVELYGKALLDKYNADGEFRALVQQQYPDVPVESAIMDLAQAKLAEGRLTSTGDRKFSAAYRPRSSGGSAEPAGVGDLVTGLDITYGPNDASVRANRYVGLQSTNVPLAGTPAINLTTGSRVAQIPENITDTRIVALAEIPVGATDAYRGMPITQNIADARPDITVPKEVLIVQGKVKRGSRERVERYAIDRNALPANLSNNKVVQAAIAKFDQGAVQSPQNSVPSQQQFIGVPQGGF